MFILHGYYAPIRLDRNIHGGGIIIYIRANIPHRTLGKLSSNTDNEGIFIELLLRKENWLLYRWLQSMEGPNLTVYKKCRKYVK